jgi:hypothetical protein
MDDLALQKNAADPEQGAFAGRTEAEDVRARHNAKAAALSSYAGHRDAWERLAGSPIFDRVMAPGSDLIAIGVFLGRREAGLDEYLTIRDEHPDAFRLMHAEAAERLKQRKDEIAASKTRRRRPETNDDE